MLPFMLAAAALSTATSIYSANRAASANARAAGAASRAEGEAIAKERLNTTLRNSYSTAMQQLQLGLKKRQLASQSTAIRSAELSAQGNAMLAAAATGSTGASVGAVASDIEQKSQAARDLTNDAFENAVENYNNDLKMMVINTDQSAPNVRQVEYTGPSGSEMLIGGLVQGISTFASDYAMRKMNLGLGSAPSTNVASPAGQYSFGQLGSGTYGLYGR